jgi:hypothetical protein
MPETAVAFAILEGAPGAINCAICKNNPATLRSTGTHDGPCCLQCAFSMLADLAHSSVDDSIRKTTWPGNS